MSNRVLICGMAVLSLALPSCTRDTAATQQEHMRKGAALIAAGNVDAAIIEYRHAVRLSPRDAEARTALGRAFLSAGDRRRAVDEFVRAADLQPDSDEAQLRAGNALLVAGRYPDAAGRADRVLARDEAHPQALLLKGYALAGLQQIETAVEIIEKTLESGRADRSAASALAMLELTRGNAAAARDLFERAARAAPEAVGPQLALAQVYWASGDIAKAEAVFRAALALDPAGPMTNRAFAAFLIAAKRASEAEPFLKTWVARSDDVSAGLVLADFYAALSRRDDALAALNTVRQTPGPAALAATLRVVSLEHTGGRRAEAHSQLDTLIAANPQHVPAQLLKARFLLDEGRATEALPVAQRVISRRPEDAVAQYTLGLIYRALGNDQAATDAFTEALKANPNAADAQVELADLRLRAGRVDDAVSLAGTAAAARPSDREAQLILVRSLIAKGDGPRATAAAEALVSAHGNWPPAHVAYGLVNLRRRNFAVAEQSFLRALAAEPDAVDALQGLVSVKVATGRMSEGRDVLLQAVKRRPRSADVAVLVAELDLAERRMSAAEQGFLHALELEPTHLNAFSRLAQLYSSQRRLDEAQTKYEEIARNVPHHVIAHTMVGLLLQLKGRADEARTRYEKVLEIAPRSAVAANNLAWLLADQGVELDRALELAQTATRELPDSIEVADTLGWVHLKAQRSSQAITAFTRATAKEPQNPTYQYHLGLAYLQAYDWLRARTALETALQQPGFVEAEAARKALLSIPPTPSQ